MEMIAVIGAGLMGSGIAQSLAMGGKTVYLYDISDAALEKGMNSIQKALPVLSKQANYRNKRQRLFLPAFNLKRTCTKQ